MSIMQSSSQRPYLQKGFTLVEVMIVVAIIAILGAIAIPAYNGYISTSKMKSAEAIIEQIPILLETYRAENGSFPPNAGLGAPYTYTESDAGGLLTNTIGQSVATGGAGLTDFAPRSKSYPANKGILYHYSISIANSGTVNETATFWATPQTGRGAPSGNVPNVPATYK